jgi:hypothetical protein
MKKFLIVLILSVLFLTSCAPEKSSYDVPVDIVVNNSTDIIYRYIDDEADVVCWVCRYRGGISCLPISETSLSK